MINRILHLAHRITRYCEFRGEFVRFKALDGLQRFPIEWKDRYPCMEDRTSTTFFDRHYTYHTAWAARVLAKINPLEHVDISSSLYFAAIASAFYRIRYYDYRPPDLELDNLHTGLADLMSLPFDDRSLSSISCMHVVEHIGLGRYGERIDPKGDLKAISELKRVTAIGGHLIFVVPVGKRKLRFNAHRIYDYDQLMGWFDGFHLIEFALVPDGSQGRTLVFSPSREFVDCQNYGCGCLWLKRYS